MSPTSLSRTGRNRCVSVARFLIAIVAIPVAMVLSISSSAADEDAGSERICVSLRALTSKVSELQRAGQVIPPEIATLSGLGYLEGYASDAEGRDILLWGIRGKSIPSLHLDDLVVNLRNVWQHQPFPYCSLDPRPEDVQAFNAAFNRRRSDSNRANEVFQEARKAWGAQMTVVGGVPSGSRHAHVMIDADYHMKKVSQGLADAGGIHSVLERSLNEAERAIRTNSNRPLPGASTSRFWFSMKEGCPRFIEDVDVVYLFEGSVVVLTEKQITTADGHLYDSEEDDPHATAFALEFSRQFRKAAGDEPVYADLENLYRLSAILRAVRLRSADTVAHLDLDFLLTHYLYGEESPMPASLPGLTNTKEVEISRPILNGKEVITFTGFVCGGVSMEVKVIPERFVPDPTTQLETFRRAVLGSRPSPDTLAWSIQHIPLPPLDPSVSSTRLNGKRESRGDPSEGEAEGGPSPPPDPPSNPFLAAKAEEGSRDRSERPLGKPEAEVPDLGELLAEANRKSEESSTKRVLESDRSKDKDSGSKSKEEESKPPTSQSRPPAADSLYSGPPPSIRRSLNQPGSYRRKGR